MPTHLLMTQAKSISPLTAGFIFALASAAMFAIRPIFVKLVYAQGVDSTTLIGFRMLFSMPIYALMLVWLLRDPEMRAKLNRKNVLAASFVGLFGYYFASFLDLKGLEYVTAQLGRMMLYTYPTMVVLLGAWFFGEKITARTLVALAITYLGVGIIFGHDLQEFGADVKIGALFIFASALSFAIYLLLGKSLIDQLGSRLFTCIALISASLAIFVHYAVTRSISQPEVNAQALCLILVIAIFCTVIPTFFTTAAVARIGADRTGIVAMIGPAFTSSFAVLILSEAFTIYHATGIVITVLGVWVLRRRATPSVSIQASKT